MARPFSTHQAALERHALRTLSRGAAHVGVRERFRTILVLADRLVAAAVGDSYEAVPGQLDGGLALLESAPEAAAVALSQALEPALKLLLLHVGPDEHRRLSQKRRGNLYDVVLALGLLDEQQVELPVEESGKILDEVRRACLVAKEERNAAVHRGDHVRQAAVVALLAAIDLHRERLQGALAGLVHAVPTLDGLDGIVEEYTHHGRTFVGRVEVLDRLRADVNALRREGGYLLLHAPEGQGKSALVTAFVRAETWSRPLIGIGGPEASRRAPWLGGALLVFGKASAGRSPVEVASMLVRQANALLLDPVPEPAGDARPADARACLQRAVSRLSEEAGGVLLVVDALDELDRDVLGVLPPHLGPGVVGVLTCRSGHPVYRRVVQELRPRERALAGLSEDETRELVRVRAGVDDAAWAERLHEVSVGSPLHVRLVADQLLEAGGRTDAVDPRAGFAPALQARVDRWRKPDVRMRDDAVRNALYILALLEPAGAVEWDVVAELLCHRGCDVRADELREELAPHGAELLGVGGVEIKLAARPLAEHVRDRVLTGRLLTTEIGRVADGLVELDPLPEALVAAVVVAWEELGGAFEQGAERIVEAFIAAERFEELTDLARLGMRGRQHAPPTLLRGLRVAAEVEDDAAGFLGLCLVEGMGVEPDADEGFRLIERAVEGGTVWATAYLGQQLLVGVHLPQDLARSEELLVAASEAGDDDALATLVQAWIGGLFGVVQPERALEALRARNGDAQADVLLAAVLNSGLVPEPEDEELAACLQRIHDAGEEGIRAVGRVRLYCPGLAPFLEELDLRASAGDDVLDRLRDVAQMGFGVADVLLAISRLATEPEAAMEELRAALVTPLGALAVAEYAVRDPRLASLRGEIVAALGPAVEQGIPRAAGVAGVLAGQLGDVSGALALFDRDPAPLQVFRFARAELVLESGTNVAVPAEAAREWIVQWVAVGPIRHRLPPRRFSSALDCLRREGTAAAKAAAAAVLATLAAEDAWACIAFHALQQDVGDRLAWVAEARAGRDELWMAAWLAPLEEDHAAYRAAIEGLEGVEWVDAARAFRAAIESGQPPIFAGPVGRVLALLAWGAGRAPSDPGWEGVDGELGDCFDETGAIPDAAEPVWVRLAVDHPEARVAGAWLWRHGVIAVRPPRPEDVPPWLLEQIADDEEDGEE